MTLQLTDYTEDLVNDHFLRAQSYTPAVTVYAALFTSATTDAGGGTEATGGGYARQAISFGAAASGEISNDAVIAWSNMPAATVTHAAIYDDPTAGNMLVHGALTTSKTVSSGQGVEIAIGDLTVGFTTASNTTTWFRNTILDRILRNQAYTPGTVYLGLYNTATDASGGGTEVTGGSYARQAVTFTASSGGVSSNTVDVNFTDMPADTVTHAAVLDALTSGNMMLENALVANVSPAAGDTVRFEGGEITHTVR